MKMAASLMNSLMGKALFGVLGFGIAIGSLIAVGWFAFQAPRSSLSLDDTRWALFIASMLIQLTGLLFMPILWYRLLRFFLESPNNEESSYSRLNLYTSYSRSWLARYIPGRIWMFGGRLIFATRAGISSEAVIRSMAFEAMLVFGTLTAIGACLFLTATYHFSLGLLVLVLGFATLGGGIPVVQRMLAGRNSSSHSDSLGRRVIQFTYRIFIGDKPFPVKGSFWGVAVYGLLSCSQLAFIVLLAESFVDLTLSQALTIAGAWGFSTTLGYFTFIAPGPGGLGVRDGIALVFFSQVIDLPSAGFIVGVSRIATIIIDLVFVAVIEVVVIIERIARRSPDPSVRVETR